MAWCLLMLATHPDVQQKARQEIESVIGDSQLLLTYELFEQLEYCTAVIKETLRYYRCLLRSSMITTTVQNNLDKGCINEYLLYMSCHLFGTQCTKLPQALGM